MFNRQLIFLLKMLAKLGYGVSVRSGLAPLAERLGPWPAFCYKAKWVVKPSARRRSMILPKLRTERSRQVAENMAQVLSFLFYEAEDPLKNKLGYNEQWQTPKCAPKCPIQRATNGRSPARGNQWHDHWFRLAPPMFPGA
jgi:hypothetical protein